MHSIARKQANNKQAQKQANTNRLANEAKFPGDKNCEIPGLFLKQN